MFYFTDIIFYLQSDLRFQSFVLHKIFSFLIFMKFIHIFIYFLDAAAYNIKSLAIRIFLYRYNCIGIVYDLGVDKR